MTSRPGKTAISPARKVAMDLLYRVEAEGAFASVLIASIPEASLERRDRALVQELVLGVLKWRRTLDYFIERYAGRDPSELDLQVLITLRLGLYQLRYLSRVPASAAVNESVNLVRRAGVSSAAGMVNAVLRRAARSLSDLPGGDTSDPIEKLEVQASHPAWMLERWTSALGRSETQSLALANNQVARAAFRVNTLGAEPEEALAALERAGVLFHASALAPGAYVAEQGSALASTTATRDGLIYVQDEASQLVSLLLDPRPGERVLDLCAAPGSKTSHVAALTRDESMIVACDLHPHRLTTLASICKGLKARSVHAVALDATSDLPFTQGSALFDRVLVDAPCSGTGTLRENPEIKWRLTAGDIARMAEIQFKLLQRGARAVAPGGRLVYSTCSIEVEENEGIIRKLLELGAPFEILKPDASADLVTKEGFVRTYPHRHGCAGFFAAVLKRK
jgi:16S rRNA (cytosine967-C5)-methyltransferase